MRGRRPRFIAALRQDRAAVQLGTLRQTRNNLQSFFSCSLFMFLQLLLRCMRVVGTFSHQ